MIKDGRSIHTVRVGPKGQIVIPKEVRDLFGIEPGDSLIMLADSEHGIALERMSVFSAIADSIFAGRGREIYPDQSDEDTLHFAQAIRTVSEEDQEETDDDTRD